MRTKEELPQYNPKESSLNNFKRAFQEGRTQTLELEENGYVKFTKEAFNKFCKDLKTQTLEKVKEKIDKYKWYIGKNDNWERHNIDLDNLKKELLSKLEDDEVKE